MVDWQNFTPWTALTGGILIGLAAALFVLVNGRVAGISGIIAGLLQRKKGDLDWRVLFVAGMLTAPLLYRLVIGISLIRIEAGWIPLVLAGLLVGVGARVGSGCTSGHGVCGLSRLSLRSLVATLAFMTAGFVTVYVARHLSPGWGAIMLASFLSGIGLRWAPECDLGRGICSISNPRFRWFVIAIVLLVFAIVGVYTIIRISNGF